MHFPRPRSLNGLVLTGFALVAAPLLFAIVWALYQIDGFARASEILLADSKEATELSGELNDLIEKMERQARTYQILQEPANVEYLPNDVATMDRILDGIVGAVDDDGIHALAASIEKQARIIASAIRREPPDSDASTAAIERFGILVNDASMLGDSVDGYIRTAATELREDAARAQRTLTWQMFAIVPVTIGVVLIFTLLIGRPIRELDDAISQLGEGGISKAINVRGPSDLQALGRQLEWLRVRLLELAQEKNRFLRHMSHELKTPLANIREGTDLLLDGTVGKLDDPQQEVTTILRSNGLKLQHLIENLLSFSAWQAKSETLMLSDFNLRDLLKSAVGEQRLAMAAQKIRLRADIEDIEITVDRDKMRTVLDNLLSNALKFTPRNGTIYIKARRGRRSFQLEVADTGPGIPLEEQQKIFNAFYQGQNQDTASPVAGTGIGLSVVVECVEAHDGTIEIVNGEYSGAHFRIHIPQEKMDLQEKLVANG